MLSWWGMCPSVPHLGYATVGIHQVLPKNALFSLDSYGVLEAITAKRLALTRVFTRVVIVQEFRRLNCHNKRHTCTPPFVRTARGKSRG